jgi:hypothetical protein
MGGVARDSREFRSNGRGVRGRRKRPIDFRYAGAIRETQAAGSRVAAAIKAALTLMEIAQSIDKG